MTKARAIRIHSHGGPEVLTAETIDLPDPGAGEVLIRHTAIGVNFQDVYHRSGFYPLSMPSGIGTEAVGLVEKLGAGVGGLAIGDRVGYAGGAPGSYSDYRNFPADRLVRIPAGVNDETAAAVLLKGMTVEYLLNRCYPVKAGEAVLFYAASGGVGLIAGQWGRHLGARMIGVAGNAEKCKLARANGYAEVIDRGAQDVVAQVKALTGGAGVPVAYDSVGRATFETTMKCLAPRAMFVSFGTTTGAPPAVEAGMLQKLGSLYFTRPTLVTYTATRAELDASAAAVFGLIAKGVLKVAVNARYPLAEAARAHADLEAARTTGSSVLLP